MVAALISAIVGVALSFGAQHVIDRVQRLSLGKKGKSADQIIAQLMSIVKSAENQYTGFASQLAAKLNALPNADTIMSNKAARFLREKRGDIEKKIADSEQQLAKLQPLEQRISTYALQPESYRASKAGRNDYTSLKTDVEKTLKE